MSKKLTRELIAQKVKSDRLDIIRKLNLWGNNIEDISIIREMPSLEIVSLSINKIRTLAPFGHLKNLRELYLRRNLISNLNEIKHLTSCDNLTVLWLGENPICDNPNYRNIIICILPQLQKLDDILITDEERDKAEKKLSGNFKDDEDEDENENDNNNDRINNDEDDEKNNYYENNNNKINSGKKGMSNNKKVGKNKYEDDDEDEDNFKNKNRAQYNKYEENDKYNDYEERHIRANAQMTGKYGQYKNGNSNYGNKYEDSYGEKPEKKKGNSNVLNCVISLLKELSPNELKIVKREIERMNN